MDLLQRLATGAAWLRGRDAIHKDDLRFALSRVALQPGSGNHRLLSALELPVGSLRPSVRFCAFLATISDTLPAPLAFDGDSRAILERLKVPWGQIDATLIDPTFARHVRVAALNYDAAADGLTPTQLPARSEPVSNDLSPFGAASSAKAPRPLEPLSPSDLAVAAHRIRVALEGRLKGQALVQTQVPAALMESPSKGKGPLAAFFFVGASGSGKSFAAEVIGNALATPSTDLPMADPATLALSEATWDYRVFDLASYTGANQSFGLVGLTAGYGDASPGELTRWLRGHPRSVIVFDHLDKAHPNTQNVLLEMFDSGVLTDRYGFYEDNDHRKASVAPAEVDVSQSVFIFIAAVGDDIARNEGFLARFASQPEQGKQTLLRYLRNVQTMAFGPQQPQFDATLLSRLGAGAMLLFAPLDEVSLRQLAMQGLHALASEYRAAYRLRLDIEGSEDLLVRASLLAYGAEIDARNLSAPALRGLWFPEVDQWLIDRAGGSNASATLRVGFAPGSLDKLEPILASLTGRRRQGDSGDPPDLVRCLRRRNRAVSFKRTFSAAGPQWTLTLSNPTVIIPQRPDDFSGRSALMVEVPSTGFQDIAGHTVVKARLQQTIQLLAHPEKLEALGVPPPRGLLLYGPPGTGKTMLAKALSAEADLPFIATTGVDLIDPEKGHELFERAHNYAPSMVFIDEIEVLGRRDSGGYVPAINALLTALDGFEGKDSPVFVVAATNYPERVDPALLRPGRLGLHIEVPMLDREARRVFVERYKQLPGGNSLDVEQLLDATTGLTGAALEAIRQEAAYTLLREQRTAVDPAFMHEVITTERYGPRSSVAMSEEQKRLTAYHEAGHAVVSMALFPQRKIEQISIVPRSRALGFTTFNAEGELHHAMTASRLIDELAVLLAGRCAQELLEQSAEPDDWASDDIRRATQLALRAAASWALDPNHPPMDYTQLDGPEQWRTDPVVRRETERRLIEARVRARDLLQTRKLEVEQLASQLMRDEVVIHTSERAAPAAGDRPVLLDEFPPHQVTVTSVQRQA